MNFCYTNARIAAQSLTSHFAFAAIDIEILLAFVNAICEMLHQAATAIS
jgi:hypothetical protein